MTSGTFHSKIAGVTAKNNDGFPRQRYIRRYCKPGIPLILKREPNNPYDKNAISAWIKATAFFFFSSEVQIGYLNADVAEELAHYIDKGGHVTGYITEVTGGTGSKKSFGVNILLSKI